MSLTKNGAACFGRRSSRPRGSQLRSLLSLQGIVAHERDRAHPVHKVMDDCGAALPSRRHIVGAAACPSRGIIRQTGRQAGDAGIAW